MKKQVHPASRDLSVQSPGDATPPLHVLTITPFYPSVENEVNGCFIKEPLDLLATDATTSTVLAVSPLHHSQRRSTPLAPATWLRFPQIPGNLGLSSAGRSLYLRLAGRASRIHHERPISVIHAHGALPCGQAAALLAKRLGVPFVVSVHGLDVFNQSGEKGAAAHWRRSSSIACYQSAHTVVCVSGKVQQLLCDNVPGHVSTAVVYNGVDAEFFAPVPTAHTQGSVVLAVGNLIPTKGQDLLVRALARLVPAFPQLKCRFIGEGPDLPRLRSLANELGIREQVEFLGRHSRKGVADAMRRCTVFALPSRSEGLGCVYLEAMACAKPVVACRGQGIEEIIDHEKNGWLISPDNLDELTAAVATMLRNPNLCLNLGSAARQTVLESLTLSHQARRLEAIYREAAGSMRAAPEL